MTATAKVICDSISDHGVRLTTLQLRYPRMVHADFMTHRVFSRNGRSSRAVPFATLVKEDPYVPHFLKNQPGMVASEELPLDDYANAGVIWMKAARQCQEAAQQLADLGVHKQWINRMLEWFGYIDVLVTSTDWSNFFELRLDGGAQPEIIELANAMKDAIDSSSPARCVPGAWHLPYVDFAIDTPIVGEWIDGLDGDQANHYGITGNSGEDLYMILRRISVARCARLTIKPFDGDASIEKEIKRYELLMESRPVHASPAEHVATPDKISTRYYDVVEFGRDIVEFDSSWDNEEEHGNFYGWRQFRKMIPHNTIYDR